MKRFVGVITIATAVLSGCAGSNPDSDTRTKPQAISVALPDTSAPTPRQPAPAITNITPGASESLNDVVAMAGARPITLRELVDPLVESRGLTMLVNLVELELARQNAAKPEYHVVVTQKDFDAERERKLESMFKDSADDAKLQDALDTAIMKKDAAEEAKIREEIKSEREDYLAQVLINQHIDPVEFDLVLKIDAYLRKILEEAWKDKITNEDVNAAYLQMYGEKVEVRYMDLVNMKEVAEAERRLKSGDPFENVAKDMSHDGLTAPSGGLLIPFPRTAVKVPQIFRDAAFSVRDGQTSDVLEIGTHYMLLKRLRSIAPQAVSLDDVKDPKDGKIIKPGVRPIVYRKLYNTLMDAGLKGMKRQLDAQAHKEMQIVNPILKKQVEDNAARQLKADQKAKEELDRQQRIRDKLPPALRHLGEPTTRTAPATGAATQADPAAAGERPPATQPGSIHSFELPKLDTQPSALPNANK